MVRRAFAIFVLALAIPAAALAAKPSHPSKPTTSKAAPKVMYVLKGTLWNYTAASSTAAGSVTINVTHSNYHGRLLKNTQLTFTIAASTALTLKNDTIANGTKGVVKFRALKNTSGTNLMAALTTATPMTAFQVIG